MGNSAGGLSVYNGSGEALRVTFSAFGRPVCWSRTPVAPGTIFACEAALPLLCLYAVSVASVETGAAGARPPANSLHGVLAAGQCVGVDAGLAMRVLDAYELSRRLRRSSAAKAVVVERSALVEGPTFVLKILVALVLASARRIFRRAFGAAAPAAAEAAAAAAGDDDARSVARSLTGRFSELAEDEGALLVAVDDAPPAEAAYAPVLEFVVEGAGVADVAAAQWDDPAFYAKFLADAAPDVGDWVAGRRTVLTRHPLGVRPPAWTGVRSAIPTRKKQRRYVAAGRVVVAEESQFHDIPFSDSIVVRTLWVVDAAPAAPAESRGGARCRVLFRIVFGDGVPRMLRGLVAQRTADELRLVYDAYEAETRRALGAAPGGS